MNEKDNQTVEITEEERAKFASYMKEKEASENKPKKIESDFVKVTLQRPGFSEKTGKPLHKPYEQFFGVREWGIFIKNPNGIEVKKYHNLPDGCVKLEEYQKAQAAKQKKRDDAAAKARANQSR